MNIIKVLPLITIVLIFNNCNKENNNKPLEQEVIKIICADPLSTEYLKNPDWKKELRYSLKTYILDKSILINRHSLPPKTGGDFYYNIISFVNENKIYVFPMNDEKYYYIASKMNLKYNRCNDSLCSQYLREVLYPNVSLERHLNRIMDSLDSKSGTDIIFADKIRTIIFDSIRNCLTLLKKYDK